MRIIDCEQGIDEWFDVWVGVVIVLWFGDILVIIKSGEVFVCCNYCV